MTNQEAISVLESINAKTDYFLINDDARAEAIDMAISALQAQDLQSTCNQLATDCISRRAAIDALYREIIKRRLLDEMYDGALDEFQTEEILRKLPSAQSEYEELTPEEAASEIASGSTMSAWYWLDDMMRLTQMGYAICRKR